MMERVADVLVRFEAHQAGDGQRDFAGDLAVLDDDEAALDFSEPVGRERHVVLVDADDADIVAVMADGRGDRALLQAEALDEAVGVVAVLAVALDDRDLDDVVDEIDTGLVARCRKAIAAMFGDDLAGQ